MLQPVRFLIFFVLTIFLSFCFSNAANMKYTECKEMLKDAPGSIYEQGSDFNDQLIKKDSVGISGVCRTSFPTYSEIQGFYRTSSAYGQGMKFVVRKMYCAILWPWSDTCSAWGPSWFDNKSDNYQIGQGGCQTSYVAFLNYGGVCKDSIKKYTAYHGFDGGLLDLLSIGFDSTIGSIDMPMPPGPPIFNKTIVPSEFLEVSALMGEDRFERPAVKLELKNSLGDVKGSVDLFYNFNKKDDDQETQDFNGKKYSLSFNAATSNICVVENFKDTVGCVGRLTMKESGVSMTLKSVIDNGELGGVIKFGGLRLKDDEIPDNCVYCDKDYAPCSKDNEECNELCCPGKGSLKENYVKQLYLKDKEGKGITKNILKSDAIKAFGIDFNLVIPEFEDDAKTKVKYIYGILPVVDPEAGRIKESCSKSFIEVDQGGDNSTKLVVPAGIRDRTFCKGIFNYQKFVLDSDGKIKFDTNKKPIKDFVHCEAGKGYEYENLSCAKLEGDDYFNALEQAYCTGIYKYAKNNERDKICIEQTLDQELVCDDIKPIPCNRSYLKPTSEKVFGQDKFTRKDISSKTNFADFSDDGFDPNKTYPDGTKFYGKCDKDLGLENSKCQSLNGKTCINNMDESKLVDNSDKGPYYEIDSKLSPESQIVHGQCVFENDSGKNSCRAVTGNVDALGNASWTKANVSKNKSDYKGKKTDSGLILVDQKVSGQCMSGYQTKDGSLPKRVCRIIFGDDDHAAKDKFISAGWTDIIENPCMPTDSIIGKAKRIMHNIIGN